jgi:hypothetical protein
MVNILDFIPEGTERPPVTREKLVTLTGLSDRAVRNEINIAKRQKPIINVGNGYYIPNDPDDPNLKHYINQETHRIMEISCGLRKHKALYRFNKAQERLDI